MSTSIPGDPTAGVPATPGEPEPQRTAMELEVELLLSRLLWLGVVVASALVALGLAQALVQGGALTLDPALLAQGPARGLSGLAGAIQASTRGPGQPLIVAGIIVLVLTPVLRVGAAAVLFARGGDRMYMLFSLGVLLLLLCSIFCGREI